MKYLILIVTASFGLLTLSACSSLTYKKEPQAAQIKKVAIIAIASEQPRNSQEKVMDSLMGNDHQGFELARCEGSAHLAPIAKSIEAELRKDAGFQVVAMDKIKSDETYVKIANENEKATLHALIANKNTCYRAFGIIDYYKWNSLSLSDIAKIKAALKVDAVLRVLVQAEQETNSVMGVAIGGTKTHVRLNVAMYNGVDEAPIWYDTNAQGDVVAEGTTSVLGFTDRNVLNQKAVMGSESAARTLVKRYQNGI